MRIILTGPKCSGKSTCGKLFAARHALPFFDTDLVLRERYAGEYGESPDVSAIYSKLGESEFRAFEQRITAETAEHDWCVISTGGSTLLNAESRQLLSRDSFIILLCAAPDVLWQRLLESNTPSVFLKAGYPAFKKKVEHMTDVISPRADAVIDTGGMNTDDIIGELDKTVSELFALKSNAPNWTGDVLRVVTFGESHGPMMGAVIDGLKPGFELSESDIGKELEKRRPGQSRVTSPRKENDAARIVSGVFEGRTTGAPVAVIIENKDQDPSRYDALRDLFRPGHADFVFWRKYGLRDHRGGGRSSGRETVSRTAAGAIAKKLLAEQGISVTGYALEIGGIRAKTFDLNNIETNPVRCPDPEAAREMESAIMAAAAEGNSVGGIVRIVVKGVPAGLGDPVFAKLDARLGAAILSVGGVKGVEFGKGFQCAKLKGSEMNDQMHDNRFLSNNAGGILGGISSGEPIVIQVAVKPTPSISTPQKTLNTKRENQSITVEGRHDPCIVPRIIPVLENITAMIIRDVWEIQKKLRRN